MCINFKSILSSFDKKGTLLKWLKEVEKKLPHSVLTSVAVEQVDATHIKIVFTYEDGTVVESENIVLTSANAAYLNTVIKAGTGITITLNGEVLTVALSPSVRTAIQAAQTAANNAQATADGKSIVIANPTLAGTENNLTGISVNGIKYKVPAGGSGGGVFNLGNVGEFVSNSGGYISHADYSTIDNDKDLLIEISTDEGNSAYFRYIGTTGTGNSLLYGCVHYGEGIDDNENINMYITIHSEPYNQGYKWELTCINGYKLPIASATELGGVKVGNGLTIAEDGTLSAAGGSDGGGTKLYRHTIMGGAYKIISTYSSQVKSYSALSQCLENAVYIELKPSIINGDTGKFIPTKYLVDDSSAKFYYINSISAITELSISSVIIQAGTTVVEL